MAEAVLVNGFEDGSGDHQMSLSVNGQSCPLHFTDNHLSLPFTYVFMCLKSVLLE